MKTQIHPVLSNNMLPAPLLRPLKFGDPEQIKALYEVDGMITDMTAEAEDEGVAIEALCRFEVTVTVVAEYTVTVLAANEEAAIEKAEEKHEDLTHDDLDFDVDYYARKVNS
jgi:hypothetical protein